MESDDPRSIYYHRIYNKEPINYKRLFIIVFLDVLFSIIIFFTTKKILYVIIGNMLYYILCIKYILILLIKIYQRLAPISIRSKCRFEPSCSNYMLICLEKYGLFKGLKKGVNRLKRCNINGGGFDEP